MALRNALADRTVLQEQALSDLLASSQDIQEQFREWQAEIHWSSWAQDALKRAMPVRRVFDARERGRATAARQAYAPVAPRSTSASSHAPAAGRAPPLQRYLSYFCGGGRP